MQKAEMIGFLQQLSIHTMHIREATTADHDAVWEIFRQVVTTGDTYVFDPNTPREDLDKLWFAPYMKTFVALEAGEVVGTYFIKPNQIGLGDHIANCGYMVHPQHHGKDIGKQLCVHSLELAPALGYKAMQFNFVVSTNTNAVKLWQQLGFQIVGTIPKAFRHLQLGFVDAFVMYREV